MPISAVSLSADYKPQFPAKFRFTITPPAAVYNSSSSCFLFDLYSIDGSRPSNPIDEQMYFDSGEVYYWSQYSQEWVLDPNHPRTVEYGYAYRYNGALYYYDEGRGEMRLQYASWRLYPTGVPPSGVPYVYGYLDDGHSAVTFDYTYEYPGDDNSHAYTASVHFYNAGNQQVYVSGHVMYENIIIERIQGRAGYGVNGELTVQQIPELPVVDTSELEFRVNILPTEDAKASPLIPRNLRNYEGMNAYGFIWYITKSGGWSDTATSAERNGHIEILTNGGNYNWSILRLKFREPGTYHVWCRVYYDDEDWDANTINLRIWQIGHPTSDTFVVYGNPAAGIEIDSVTPAVYKYDSTDPLDGAPPYNVVFRDTSKSTDPYQAPIRSWLFTFGDTQSGINDQIYDEYQGSELVVHEPVSHSYDGYGGYTARLTITSITGATSTASVQFEPNKNSRIVSLPTFDPDNLTGTAPLLLTCNVVTAGEPAPVATWRYNLTGEQLYPYSGSKEGQWAEISLMQNGEYALVLSIDQEDQPTITRNYTVTVTPDTVYQDMPVPMTDFAVWLTQSDDVKLRPLDCAVYPRYKRVWGGADYFEFQLPVGAVNIEDILPGRLILFGYGGLARVMVITTLTDNGQYLLISGNDYPHILFASRVATVSTHSNYGRGSGHDTQVWTAEAIMRYFAVVNLRSEPARNSVRFRVVGANQNRGGKITYSARYQTIDEIMTDLNESSLLGWSSALQSDSWQNGNGIICGWQVREGVDRTITSGGANAVVLSRLAGSAQVTDYQLGLSSTTVAIVGGSEDGLSRSYTTYYEDDDDTLTDIYRREIFVDGGDAANDEEMERMGRAEINKSKIQSIRVDLLPTSEYKFGADFDVGDIVTVQTENLGAVNARITSADSVLRNGHVTTTLNVGTDMQTWGKIIRSIDWKNKYKRR